jgi:hypothetical protein
MFMAKVATASTKRSNVAKSAAVSSKPRSRSAKETSDSPLTSDLPVPASPSFSAEPLVENLQLLTERVNALEEKITASVETLASMVQTLKNQEAATVSAENEPSDETVLPVIADVIRQSIMEQLNPLVASLKRIEERVGFIGNRLKQGQSQDQRQKPPWRHDQQRHNRPPRGPNGQRAPQGQPWNPPSAASVQGHFAPRPLRGGEADHFAEDEE